MSVGSPAEGFPTELPHPTRSSAPPLAAPSNPRRESIRGFDFLIALFGIWCCIILWLTPAHLWLVEKTLIPHISFHAHSPGQRMLALPDLVQLPLAEFGSME
jgi:hypothetical protein